jgi:chemotaxis-related protein WspD
MNKRSPAARLLDRDISSESLREWTSTLAAGQPLPESGYRSILVFRIASEWLGVETACVEEVAEVGAIRRLPHRAGTLIEGIISLRGEILVCISLETLLGLPKSLEPEDRKPAQPRLVVCKAPGGKAAFVAREVYGVERYLRRDLRSSPSTIDRAPNSYTTHVLTWKEDLTLGCLDTTRLFASIDKGLS